MNILFITNIQVTPQKGGVERITDIIVKALPSKYKCYSAYFKPTDLVKTEFEDSVQLKNVREDLRQFIIKNDIDTVVVQQIGSRMVRYLNEIRKDKDFRILYFQHDKTRDPYGPLRDSMLQLSKTHKRLKKRIKLRMRYWFFPLHLLKRQMQDRMRFRIIYKGSDKVLLLTPRYIPVALKTLGMDSDSGDKFRIIRNCVTLDKVDPSELQDKEKKVLIVSRMTEERKRILLAIKIWERLMMRHPDVRDWSFDLVGSGESMPIYTKYVSDHKVPNITFCGQAESVDSYFKKSSIFMMTSYSEGWGLTLTEAQQYGVVPVSFDSYEAVREIIDGSNGVLVDEGDIDGYVEALYALMTDDARRKSMSEKCLEVSDKFSVEKTVAQWVDLLEEK